MYHFVKFNKTWYLKPESVQDIIDHFNKICGREFKEGFEIGLKEAREEGLEEGIVHGEKKAEIRILRNMIANGYKTDEALRIMGIPEAQWEALKVKLK